MKKILQQNEIDAALSQFRLSGRVHSCRSYGSGHINDTFLVEADRKYILQRINTDVFKKPAELMENISLVCSFMKEEIAGTGGDPEREALTLVPTRTGQCFFEDANGNFFRVYLFIEGTTTYNLVEKPEHFYESAYAFGRFQNLLSGFPAHRLSVTIPDFHHSVKRFADFKQAVASDLFSRKRDCEREIEFFFQHEKDLSYALDLLQKNELPLRVSHNDTKLNNILFDEKTGKALCIIDLDTIMPGLSIFDFGDSIRFGANTAEEDERDLSRVSLSLPLYSTYVKGFLAGANGKLTPLEIESLPEGAKLMTLECGMRFLADYLEGDIYFHTARPAHNLDRARTQIALVQDMERKWEEMKKEVLLR